MNHSVDLQSIDYLEHPSLIRNVLAFQLAITTLPDFTQKSTGLIESLSQYPGCTRCSCTQSPGRLRGETTLYTCNVTRGLVVNLLIYFYHAQFRLTYRATHDAQPFYSN